MEMGKRIRQYRLKRGLTQEELGKKIGVGKAAIQKYESGSVENIKRSSIETLAQVLQVTPSYLMGWDDEINPQKPDGQYHAVPVYRTLSSGCNLLQDQNILKFEPVENTPQQDNHFFLSVQGDSMSPLLNEGDIVLVKNQSTLNNGDLGIFFIDDREWIIRKITYADNDAIELHAFNPYFPIRTFQGRDCLKLQIIGKVLESRRKW